MKELSELNLPNDFLYFVEHEWVLPEGKRAKIGISDYAQDRLGDIVFIELPDVGAVFSRTEAFGTVESVKSVSELYMPLSGTVVSVNPKLEESPELVNTAPYTDGWLIILKPDNPDEMDTLMDAGKYLDMLKGLP